MQKLLTKKKRPNSREFNLLIENKLEIQENIYFLFCCLSKEINSKHHYNKLEIVEMYTFFFILNDFFS